MGALGACGLVGERGNPDGYSMNRKPVTSGSMKTKRVLMKQSRSLLAGVLAGMAAPASIGMPVEYSRITGSDLSRLRGDAARVGQDFATVIKRHGDKNKTDRKELA